MRWIKKGVIFVPGQESSGWIVSYAQMPIVDQVRDGVLRIYFSTRDTQGRTLPAYIEVEADNPANVIYVHPEPVLPLGPAGTFDDSGVMPSWLVNSEGRKYLYYIGWNPGVTVAYRLALGLAIRDDGGAGFEKVSVGPICDRAIVEPYFVTTPCVIREAGKWKMWYSSCTGWQTIHDRMEPSYHIKYAESSDGTNWERTGRICIDYDDFTGAIGRPCVFTEDGRYKMFYSYRSVMDYRTDPARAYRLGYAESENGLDWMRKDQEVGIAQSESGWDSEMIEYCFRYQHKDKTYLFYNGNGFGRSGIGYAMLER